MTYEALTVSESKTLALSTLPSEPLFSDDHVRVRVKAVGINPSDHKSMQFMAPIGAVVGCDLAGFVTEVGASVTDIQVGDRVSGSLHGCKDKNNGAFSSEAQVKQNLLFNIPGNMTFESSVQGIPSLTAAMALFNIFGFTFPKSETEHVVLVWAASTAVGMHAVTLAKAVGLKIIATASPKNFDLIKSLGADAVFDYHLNDMTVKEIQDAGRLLCGGEIAHAIDCISTQESMETASACLSQKGHMITLRPKQNGTIINNGVQNSHLLTYTVNGVAFDYGPMHVPAKPQDFLFATEWMRERLPYLFQTGYKFPCRIRLCPEDGCEVSGQKFLDAIEEGFQLLMQNKVSAEKVVIRHN